MEDNLFYYNQLRKAPDAALTPITAGDLKGKSDINPQWRIEVLTQSFGPCGIGWYTEFIERWTEEDTEVDNKGQILHGVVAWVRINLYVKIDGEWSKPIVGIGGSKQTGIGRGGKINDEVYKMAETDAISVACKKLGVAADVYWDTSTTKYSSYVDKTPQIRHSGSAEKANGRVMPTDPFEAVRWAETRAELDAVWGTFGAKPELSGNAAFITEINIKASQVK